MSKQKKVTLQCPHCLKEVTIRPRKVGGLSKAKRRSLGLKEAPLDMLIAVCPLCDNDIDMNWNKGGSK